MKLSLGKRRGLLSCSTTRGVFSILALDHRNNLRNAMNPEHPQQVTPKVMSEFKVRLIKALAPHSSAVLLDPEFGAPQVINAGALTGGTGLVVSLEATGYTGEPEARISQVLPGWSVGKTSRMGASAVKLLIYYHPDSKLAAHQEELVNSVAEECRNYDLAFFLEPLSYSLDPNRKLTSSEKREVVIKTAETLTKEGVDVLKAEFPVDVHQTPDEKEWEIACKEVSQASKVPWVLLSAGVNFDTYLRQLTVACESGASGAMAGRAVWKEAVGKNDYELDLFLNRIALERMQRVTNLCDALGKPFYAFYPQEEIDDSWYQDYGDL